MNTLTLLTAFLLGNFGNEQDSTAIWKQELNQFPDSLSLHVKYIKAIGLESPSLEADYRQQMSLNPESSTIPYAIGSAMANAYDYRAKDWLLKAVDINPNLADAWLKLSFDAERWGDEKLGSYYMGKAAEADPENPDYAFYYASSHKHLSRDEYRRKMWHVAKRFTDSERGAQALYWLASTEQDVSEKIRTYEYCKANFPPDKFRWSSSAMNDYFGVLLKYDPDKALSLAKEMVDSSEQGATSWANQLEIAKDVSRANQKRMQGEFREALSAMLNPKKGRLYGIEETLALLTTESMVLAGDAKLGFDSLLNFHTKNPTWATHARLYALGSSLGWDATQVSKLLANKLSNKAEPATVFNLERYDKDERLSLAQLKGKVVLVTYWFPGCGPCRGEFPHFENVLKKFDREQVAYVGINIAPKEDPYVLPFMKSTGHSFVPVRDEPEKRGNLPARGAPTNYLIDAEGNILYKNFMIGANNEEVLEQMIQQALNMVSSQ